VERSQKYWSSCETAKDGQTDRATDGRTDGRDAYCGILGLPA